MTSVQAVFLGVLVAAVPCVVLTGQSSEGVWQLQSSGTTAGLRGIDSVDGTVAWASGTGGTVLRTTDGGTHWQKCATPDAEKDGATLDFRGVQAWDAQTAIVMASGPGDKSRLYKTTDGCGTWRLLYTNPDKDGFWDTVSVADQNNMTILGDPVNGRFTVFDTEDGGKTWSKNQSKGLESMAAEGSFAASNSALAANWVDGPTVIGTGGPLGARVIRCDPCTGEAWVQITALAFPKGASAGIFSLNYRDWRQWVAVGGDYTKPNDSTGTAAWSSDGGQTWTASVTPPHGYRSAVQWWAPLKLWTAVGTNGSDISRDDGKTWQPLDEGNWNALSLPFVVGPNGRIARINSAAVPSAAAKR